MALRDELDSAGFALRRAGVSTEGLEVLGRLLPSTTSAGVRNLLWLHSGLRAALAFSGIDQLAAEVLGAGATAINATVFDKTADSNWKVPGHQDLMMAVEERIDEPGFTGWSTKAGVEYVEPPAEVLGKLVALRVHLDDCPAANGALAVVPGSHRGGKLSDCRSARPGLRSIRLVRSRGR